MKRSNLSTNAYPFLPILVTLSVFTFTQDPEARVIKEAGVYGTPACGYEVSLKTSEMGGFLNMNIVSKAAPETAQAVPDVTAIQWLDGEILIYSVSPIYGDPGIFVFDCIAGRTTQLVAPKNFDKAYPNGTDFFELSGISSDTDHKIIFFYAPEVDSIDFNSFRRAENLYQINLDGTNFERAVK